MKHLLFLIFTHAYLETPNFIGKNFIFYVLFFVSEKAMYPSIRMSQQPWVEVKEKYYFKKPFVPNNYKQVVRNQTLFPDFVLSQTKNKYYKEADDDFTSSIKININA